MEPFGTATLTEEIPAQRVVAAIVPRHEIMGALEDPEAQPELLLQIVSDGEDEAKTVGITWSRDELEKLLERVPGDEIKLTFDRDELSHAFADVEAHGLRERALVFAVAATGVLGAGAGIANAMPNADVGGGGVGSGGSAAQTLVTDASSAGGYSAAGTAADSMVTDASSAGGYGAPAASGSAADSMFTDASSAGGYAAPAASGSAADSMFTDASSAGGYAAPAATGSAADSMFTDASSAGGYAAPAASGSAADSMMTDVSTGGGYGPAAPVDSGSGEFLGIQAPSSTDGLLVGGVLLAIAGATFAGRRTGGTAKPA
ncbi:MAG: hypothetical protein ACJ76I_00475 [Gaiellaceae bacterium]